MGGRSNENTMAICQNNVTSTKLLYIGQRDGQTKKTKKKRTIGITGKRANANQAI